MEDIAESTAGPALAQGVTDAFRQLTGRPEPLTQSQEEKRKLKRDTSAFVAFNRATVLPRAVALNVARIMFRAEAGWTINDSLRGSDHTDMTSSSPLLLRLTQCVLQYLFPDRGFRLHQFVLFDIVREEEAAIGESIASHIAATYARYGGFNFAQAGIHCKVWTSGLDWRSIAIASRERGAFDFMQSNLTAWQLNQERILEQLEV